MPLLLPLPHGLSAQLCLPLSVACRVNICKQSQGSARHVAAENWKESFALSGKSCLALCSTGDVAATLARLPPHVLAPRSLHTLPRVCTAACARFLHPWLQQHLAAQESATSISVLPILRFKFKGGPFSLQGPVYKQRPASARQSVRRGALAQGCTSPTMAAAGQRARACVKLMHHPIERCRCSLLPPAVTTSDHCNPFQRGNHHQQIPVSRRASGRACMPDAGPLVRAQHVMDAFSVAQDQDGTRAPLQQHERSGIWPAGSCH